MQRRVLHIDMDAFFASVEQARNPALLGRPVIVGGTKEDLRGVVSAASYEARKYGVHSAMPLATAKRLCPDGVYLRGDHAHYRAVSRVVKELLYSVSPHVQMASIDEAYIDISASLRLFGGDDAIGRHLRCEIRERTGLPCTVAIASNKLVAKVAAGEAKPDGYACVKDGGEAAFLAPLPVEKLPGAGPKTVTQLQSMGIFTIGQLASMPLARLEAGMGVNGALVLQRAARGIGNSEVTVGAKQQSMSRETTFERDERDWSRIERVLASLTERCAHGLREAGMEAHRVGLKVRYADFETKSFAETLPEPTSLDSVLSTALATLIPQARSRRQAVRLVGVQLGQLRFNQHQIPLFAAEGSDRWERVMSHVDSLRCKHGFDTLHLGRAVTLK